MINEFEIVETTVPLENGSIPVGTSGTVVSVYDHGYDVEFSHRGLPSLVEPRVVTVDAGEIRKAEQQAVQPVHFRLPSPNVLDQYRFDYKEHSDTVLFEFSEGPGIRTSVDNIVWFRIDPETTEIRSISIVGFTAKWLAAHPEFIKAMFSRSSEPSNAANGGVLAHLLAGTAA